MCVRELGERRAYAPEKWRVAREQDQRTSLCEVAQERERAPLVVAVVSVEHERAELVEVCEPINLSLRRAREQHVEPAVAKLLLGQTHEVQFAAPPPLDGEVRDDERRPVVEYARARRFPAADLEDAPMVKVVPRPHGRLAREFFFQLV